MTSQVHHHDTTTTFSWRSNDIKVTSQKNVKTTPKWHYSSILVTSRNKLSYLWRHELNNLPRSAQRRVPPPTAHRPRHTASCNTPNKVKVNARSSLQDRVAVLQDFRSQSVRFVLVLSLVLNLTLSYCQKQQLSREQCTVLSALRDIYWHHFNFNAATGTADSQSRDVRHHAHTKRAHRRG